MDTAFERVVAALADNGRKARITRDGVMAQCPAHDDRNPSLSITKSDDRVLLTCFAGCQVTDICAALALKPSDLFDHPSTGGTYDTFDAGAFVLNIPTTTPTAPVTAPPQAPERLEWVYVDLDHTPVFKVVKTRLADGKKTFRQLHYRNGQWVSGLADITPILLDLPQVQLTADAGGIIVICEGEKDADTYNRNNTNMDVWATTAPMGAGKWRDSYTETLKGCSEVHIIHDNDEPGLAHARKIAESLDTAGIAYRILAPAAGKDLTDHINAGHRIDQLLDHQQLADTAKAEREAKTLQRAIDEERVRQIARDTVKKQLADADAANRFQLPAYTRTLTEELALPDEDIIYTVNQLWPTGANVSLTATFKAGKTTTINSVVKSLTDGTKLFGHFDVNHLGRVAIFNYEVAASQMRRWLREVNIHNTDRITLLNMRGHTWTMTTDYVIKKTIDVLGENNIQTWVVDPLARAFVGSGDENSNQDVGVFLDTLDYIKDQAGVANLLIAAHTGRNAEQGNSRARGASRFDDWVDVRWMLTKDPEGQRWFEADGRDVQIPESRLDWDETTRTQIIHFGMDKKKTVKDQVAARVYQIIANTAATGINRNGIIAAYKAAFEQESISGESADTGVLGDLQKDGLVYKEKVGNSWLFKATNNQYRLDA